VKGWPGGEAWINSATLLARKRVVERLVGNDERMEAPAPAMTDMEAGDAGAKGREERLRRQLERGLAAYRLDWEKWQHAAPEASDVERLLLAFAPAYPMPGDVSAVERARRLASDPVYQLK